MSDFEFICTGNVFTTIPKACGGLNRERINDHRRNADKPAG